MWAENNIFNPIGDPMTQNKIPTDEEILWKWAKKIGWDDGWDVSSEEACELIQAARAAGREEQRERDSGIARNKWPRGHAHTYASENADHYRALEDASEVISEAIRAQGKEV